MTKWLAALVPFSMLATLPAAAAIYKCKDAKGQTTFQETPCDGNHDANRVRSTPATSGYGMPKTERDAGSDSRATPASPPAAVAPAAADPAPRKIARTTAQVDERKFIAIGMDRMKVLQMAGPPDRQVVYEITYTRSQTRGIAPYIDIYEPTSGDDQTRTKVKYVGEVVSSVEREIVR